MAKKNKKPNHARLVVPGGSAGSGARPPKAPKQADKPPREEERSSRFDNTIDLTKDGALIRKKAARRRKRRHFLQVLLLVVIFGSILALYFSGVYRTLVLKGTDIVEGISISLKGSGSFPLALDASGYIESDNLGTNGVAILGEKDMVIVSGTGRELYRFQHGYGNPHITASDTRVCLYNRGGNEFTVEGRDKRITSRTTERDILFAEMSPGGALALATASRFRASIEIYSNYGDDEPQFSWEITDEKPYAAAFLPDNKHLALACVSTQGGAIHSNVYLLHANRNQVQATINGGAATVLDMQYLSSNRVLVIYDSYAALYNGDGDEIARYGYGGQDVVAVDSRDGTTAIVFSTVSNSRVTTVVLDSSLEVTATLPGETADSPRVLVGKKMVYLLTGYDVAAYDLQGNLLNSYTYAYRGYDLIWAGQALLVTAGDVQSLAWMDNPEATGPGEDGVGPAVQSGEETTSLAGLDGGEQAGVATSLPDDTGNSDNADNLDSSGDSDGSGSPDNPNNPDDPDDSSNEPLPDA